MVILTNYFKTMFESFVDDETKDFISKISKCDPKEKMRLTSEFMKNHNMNIPSYVFTSVDHSNEHEPNSNEHSNEHESDIDSLVLERRNFESKIDNLSEKDRIQFWTKYHNIPNNVNEKLDIIVSTLTTLNSNIISNFDDINSEIAILKRSFNK